MKLTATALAGIALATSPAQANAGTQQSAPAPLLMRLSDPIVPNPAPIPLWPEGSAIQRPATTEREKSGISTKPVGGHSWAWVTNVSRPTMTIYPPLGKNTGAAIMVFPGGGYEVLAMDLEGTEICNRIIGNGMTCILLKYRVPQAWRPGSRLHQPPSIQPLQDAQRAMGLVRQRAASLNIDPHRIGVIGFSAGGHLVAAISNADTRSYPLLDAADSEPSRPDFAIALYPGHLWSGKGTDLARWITISPKAPPTLLIQSMTDPVDDVHNSIAYALALREAKVPVEMHLYAEGGHAFGLRPNPFPISEWPRVMEKWLHTIGVN
jgi:acetyl esterase/lipase